MSDHYYIPLSEAAAALRARQPLREEVMRFWESEGATFPTELMQLRPSAVWARQLVSWRFEDVLFADMARQARLPTFWYPYEGDRFVSLSSLKRSYVHPVIAEGIDRNGNIINRRQRLVKRPERCDRQLLSDIVTDCGQRLVDWHRRRWDQFYGIGTVVDATTHKLSWGNTLQRDYLGLMSLFIAHGVLFEDYHGGESGDALDRFTLDVFEPAFAAVTRWFGVSPLIVRMPWSPSLALYPSEHWNTLALASTIPKAA
jgi:hypothetical protein